MRQDNRTHGFVRRLHRFMCGACERKDVQEELAEEGKQIRGLADSFSLVQAEGIRLYSLLK